MRESNVFTELSISSWGGGRAVPPQGPYPPLPGSYLSRTIPAPPHVAHTVVRILLECFVVVKGLSLLPSAMKLRRLCFYRHLSVHRGVGVSASVHAGIPHPPGADTPQEQTHLPEQTPPTPPRSRHPPGADTPPEQTPPTPPRSRHPPRAATPLEQTPPPQIRPLLQTVRILLECILVFIKV